MNRRSLLRSMFGAACLSVAQRIMPAACEVPRVAEPIPKVVNWRVFAANGMSFGAVVQCEQCGELVDAEFREQVLRINSACSCATRGVERAEVFMMPVGRDYPWISDE